MAREPFSIYKRKSKKKGIIYYVRFWNPNKKEYGTGISSQCTSKAAAGEWAREQQKKGAASIKSRDIRFKEFAAEFYNWETSTFIRASRMQERIHRTYANTLAGNLKNHIMPRFGEFRFQEITPQRIEAWLFDLHADGYKPNSIKHIYQALRNVLSEAERFGIISSNPCDKVRKPRGKRTRKGIFTIDEARKLLSETTIEKVWGPGKAGLLHYTINLVAEGAGLRTCELQAFRVGKIDFENKLVTINEIWERSHGFKKETKTEYSERTVPLSSHMIIYLKKLIPDSVESNHVIFSGKKAGMPIGHTAIGDYFRRACRNVGIHDRAERGITFHSWRHFFNTYLITKGVPIPTVMGALGHTSEEMAYSNYYHIDDVAMARLRLVQEELF